MHIISDGDVSYVHCWGLRAELCALMLQESWNVLIAHHLTWDVLAMLVGCELCAVMLQGLWTVLSAAAAWS